MPEREGTGKHPHKKTEEPWPHSKEEGAEAQQSGRAGAARARQPEKSEGREERANLKDREYRDEHGNVHHHTRTYMEQHKGEKEKQ
jgi:hypothetical protein